MKTADELIKIAQAAIRDGNITSEPLSNGRGELLVTDVEPGHKLVVGTTKYGKAFAKPTQGRPGLSEIMEQMIEADLAAGLNIIFSDPKAEKMVDPHGEDKLINSLMQVADKEGKSTEFILPKLDLPEGAGDIIRANANFKLHLEPSTLPSGFISTLPKPSSPDAPTGPEYEAALARGYRLNMLNKNLCQVKDTDLKSPWQWTVDIMPDLFVTASCPKPNGASQVETSAILPATIIVSLPKPDSQAAVEQIKTVVKEYRLQLPQENRLSIGQTYNQVAKAMGFNCWDALVAVAGKQAAKDVDLTFMGSKGQKIDIYINDEDRKKHTYFMGRTGKGKSSLEDPEAKEHILKNEPAMSAEIAAVVMGWHIENDDNRRLWRFEDGKVPTWASSDGRKYSLTLYPGALTAPDGDMPFHPVRGTYHMDLVIKRAEEIGRHFVATPAKDGIGILSCNGTVRLIQRKESTPEYVTDEYLICEALLESIRGNPNDSVTKYQI